jgi:hypothetical protein
MSVYYEESFGPLVSVVVAQNADDALRIANDTEYGLAGAIFSRDISKAMKIAEKMELESATSTALPCMMSRKCRSAASRRAAGAASGELLHSRNSRICAGSRFGARPRLIRSEL